MKSWQLSLEQHLFIHLRCFVWKRQAFFLGHHPATFPRIPPPKKNVRKTPPSLLHVPTNQANVVRHCVHGCLIPRNMHENHWSLHFEDHLRGGEFFSHSKGGPTEVTCVFLVGFFRRKTWIWNMNLFTSCPQNLKKHDIFTSIHSCVQGYESNSDFCTIKFLDPPGNLL